MKLLIVVTLCAAFVRADVSHALSADAKADIRKQELDISPDGSYTWSFDTSNGIISSASGSVKAGGQGDDATQVVQGASSWTSPEGEKVEFVYSADENGYNPQGSHIPTPPPIPEAIIRALEYIRSHPPAPEKTNRL